MLSRNQAHALLTLARPNAELIYTPVDIDGDHETFGWTVQVEGRQTHKVNGPAARGLIKRGLVEPTGEANTYRLSELGEEVAHELIGEHFVELSQSAADAAEALAPLAKAGAAAAADMGKTLRSLAATARGDAA